MNPDLKRKLEEAATKRAELNALMAEAKGDDGKESLDNIKSVDKPAEEIARRQEELKTLYGECEALKDLDANEKSLSASEQRLELEERAEKAESERDELKKDARPNLSGETDQLKIEHAAATKAVHEWPEEFIKACETELPMRQNPFNKTLSLKALFSEAAAALATPTGGWAPENLRTGVVVPAALKPVMFSDMIRMVPMTEGNADVYMEETPSADPTASGYYTAEGGVYFEDSWKVEERSSAVKDIGAFIPATRDQLDDVPGARALLQERLVGRVQRAIENQILYGTGDHTSAGGTITGLLSASTTTNQFWAGINEVEREEDEAYQHAFGRAVQLVETVGQGTVTAIVISTTDWWDLITQQESTGGFIMGGLAASEAVMPRFAGIPILKSQFLTKGEGIAGDFTGPWGIHMRDRQMLSTFWERQQNTAGDQSKPTARWYVAADARAAMTVMRATLFTKITGL